MGYLAIFGVCEQGLRELRNRRQKSFRPLLHRGTTSDKCYRQPFLSSIETPKRERLRQDARACVQSVANSSQPTPDSVLFSRRPPQNARPLFPGSQRGLPSGDASRAPTRQVVGTSGDASWVWSRDNPPGATGGWPRRCLGEGLFVSGKALLVAIRSFQIM
jgi:hypothetical protein